MCTQALEEQCKHPLDPSRELEPRNFKEELYNLIVNLQGEEMDVFTKEAIQKNPQWRLVHVIRAAIEESPY